jgi:Ca2+:H+ antiporter
VEGSVWKRKVNLFLLGIPVVVFANRLGIADDYLTLALLAGLALVPLAGFVESAVEELAELLGPFAGGLLHTTFGNIAELFLALSVLLTFPITSGAEVVLGSVAGVIIRNSLLFLGLGTLLGCWKNGKMQFNGERAGEYATVFALAVIGLSLPTLAHFIKVGSGVESACPGPGAHEELMLFCQVPLSTALAIVLLVSYLAYVAFAVFHFRAGRNLSQAAGRLEPAFDLVLATAERPDTQALFEQERERAEEREEDLDRYLHPKMARARALREARRQQSAHARATVHAAAHAQVAQHGRTLHEGHQVRAAHAEGHGEAEGEENVIERFRSLRGALALVILAVSISGVFAMSETFVGGAERLIASNKTLEDYEFFFGLIVIPVVGGLVELYGTAGSARANRMELVMATTAGATIQMILLMVPVLVLVGTVTDRPLDLVFKPIEVIIFGAATFAFMLLSRDGESSIIEGVQLIALWTLLAVTAFFLPPV